MTKKSLKSQAYNNIKEKIISCEYSPGMLLNEEILCETFNVSRTPIRDALSRLEQEGLITIWPKKGIIVSSLSISEVNNLFELRLLLEPYSIQNYGYTLDENVLMDYYQKFLRMDLTRDSKNFFVIDDNFHDFLNNAVPNHYIQENFKIINNQNQAHPHHHRPAGGAAAGGHPQRTPGHRQGMRKKGLESRGRSHVRAPAPIQKRYL